MRAKMALVLHLGGVGECMRLIWEWSVHNQESGDLQKVAKPFERLCNQAQGQRSCDFGQCELVRTWAVRTSSHLRVFTYVGSK